MRTPAEMLRAALVAGGIGTMPSAGGAWPVYVGHMADTPDNALCVYDLEGDQDGRYMVTGENITHPGYQVKARATAYRDGYNKLNSIDDYFNTRRNFEVVVDGERFILHSIGTGGVIAIGQEPEAKRRDAFTLNGTVTFTEVAP